MHRNVAKIRVYRQFYMAEDSSVVMVRFRAQALDRFY